MREFRSILLSLLYLTRNVIIGTAAQNVRFDELEVKYRAEGRDENV